MLRSSFLRILLSLHHYEERIKHFFWRILWYNDCLELLHRSAVQHYHEFFASAPYRLLCYKRIPPPPPTSLYAKFLVDAMIYEPQKSWIWVKDFPCFFAISHRGRMLGEVICAEVDRVSLQQKLRTLLDLPTVLDFRLNGNARVLIGYRLNGLRMTVPLEVAEDDFANQVFGFISMVTRE
jgi:hypothetical protein